MRARQAYPAAFLEEFISVQTLTLPQLLLSGVYLQKTTQEQKHLGKNGPPASFIRSLPDSQHLPIWAGPYFDFTFDISKSLAPISLKLKQDKGFTCPLSLTKAMKDELFIAGVYRENKQHQGSRGAATS